MSPAVVARTGQEPDDALCVAAVLAGDPESYAPIVRRHQEMLYRHTRAMGIDHDTAEDLVQDTFVRAYNRLDECRDPERFRAWLFRIGRNLRLDYLKDARRQTVPLSDAGDVHTQAAPVSTELGVTLRNALASLPDSMREAFLLKHEEGYSYDEIAVLTDASVSAAKMRVHRAREALHAFLM